MHTCLKTHAHTHVYTLFEHTYTHAHTHPPTHLHTHTLHRSFEYFDRRRHACPSSRGLARFVTSMFYYIIYTCACACVCVCVCVRVCVCLLECVRIRFCTCICVEHFFYIFTHSNKKSRSCVVFLCVRTCVRACVRVSGYVCGASSFLLFFFSKNLQKKLITCIRENWEKTSLWKACLTTFSRSVVAT